MDALHAFMRLSIVDARLLHRVHRAAADDCAPGRDGAKFRETHFHRHDRFPV
ncbi:MAG: hypothetical protein H0X36_10105 [Sphingomonadaceae bacterium]|nr:hypothetical protein [Sphingomonadaceae bacterium]